MNVHESKQLHVKIINIILNNNNNSFRNVSEYDTNTLFTFESFDYVCRVFKIKKKTLTMSEEFLKNFNNVDYVCRVFSKVGTKSFNEKKSLSQTMTENKSNFCMNR